MTPDVSTSVTGTMRGQGPSATFLPSFTIEMVVWISLPNRPPVWLWEKRPPFGTTWAMGARSQTGASTTARDEVDADTTAVDDVTSVVSVTVALRFDLDRVVRLRLCGRTLVAGRKRFCFCSVSVPLVTPGLHTHELPWLQVP